LTYIFIEHVRSQYAQFHRIFAWGKPHCVLSKVVCATIAWVLVKMKIPDSLGPTLYVKDSEPLIYMVSADCRILYFCVNINCLRKNRGIISSFSKSQLPFLLGYEKKYAQILPLD
jgi:hypothetical protein